MTSRPTEDDVLEAFLLEPVRDRSTLARYLKTYPEHADALLDADWATRDERDVEELGEDVSSAEVENVDWIERALQRVRASAPENPFAGAVGPRFGEAKRALGVKAATLAGLRDRAVDVTTVPRAFLESVADALDASVTALVEFLEGPRLAADRSFRADAPPVQSTAKMSFSELLERSGEPEEVRKRLLGEER